MLESELKQALSSDWTHSKLAAFQMMKKIEDSPLCYEALNSAGQPPICTKTLQIPKIFSAEDKKKFADICEMSSRIFEKAIAAYKADPKVRRLFKFGPGLNYLIMREHPEPHLFPILRVDIFYDEKTGDFKFCEFNTDGTSAMFENDTMMEFLKDTVLYKQIEERVEYLPLVEPWVDAFLEDCAKAGLKEKPNVLITDILENAYLPELYAFQEAFEKRGLVCQVIDIRDLVYEDCRLKNPADGTEFDVVYRRAVTRDVMDHAHDVSAFLHAVHDNNVLCLGDFQTQIPHSKAINIALQRPELRKYLDEEETDFLDAHLPATFDLTRYTSPEVKADKNKWIIKPKDGYGAKGVWAGVDVSEKLWKKLIDDCTDAGFIVQEYVQHYHTDNIDLLHDADFRPYANLTGLYTYNGKFAGVYSRLSDSGIVSTQYNERMVPTLFLKEEAK